MYCQNQTNYTGCCVSPKSNKYLTFNRLGCRKHLSDKNLKGNNPRCIQVKFGLNLTFGQCNNFTKQTDNRHQVKDYTTEMMSE